VQVAALAALCFAAAVAYVLFDADRVARGRADRVAEVVARDLELQQAQSHWVEGTSNSFPDLDRISPALIAPGLCIAYRAPNGPVLRRVCGGVAPGDVSAPPLFADLYQRLFDAGRESVRPVMFRGEAHGEAVASIDRQTVIGESWRETSRLVGVMAVALLVLCVLVYVALANVLQPTRAIRGGLERLAAGDLSARLPRFDLAELSRIRDIFNHLAGTLEATLAKNNTLTRQLIAVQDEERRHLARELHDEFGQCLAAISAVAASAGQTARAQCPALVPECLSIARTAAHMMEVLRSSLLRLRPADVDELGLAASLEGLVAGWNSRGGGTRFLIELSGEFDSLSRDFAANIYRVAQEAITNAAKHAQASRVTVRLRVQEALGADARAHVELAVEDDGTGDVDLTFGSGMGLVGIRERVSALGGRLNIEASRPSGLTLRAQIPLPQAATPTEAQEAV
jgi:signal transduction histidine kinase